MQRCTKLGLGVELHAEVRHELALPDRARAMKLPNIIQRLPIHASYRYRSNNGVGEAPVWLGRLCRGARPLCTHSTFGERTCMSMGCLPARNRVCSCSTLDPPLLCSQKSAAPARQDSQDNAAAAAEMLEQRRRAAAALLRQRAAEAAVGPLLVDADGGGGGVQGLAWFQHLMRRDSDGDCAAAFLEEQPSRQEQRRRQQQEQRAVSGGGGGGGGGGSPEAQPLGAKQQRGAELQDASRRMQLAGPSDLLLDRGNVFVVPREPQQAAPR